MLQDLQGFFRRQINTMNAWQVKKDLKQINSIKTMLEKKLKELGEAV